MTHKESRKRRLEIATFVNEGHTLNEACVHFSVSRATAYAACCESGIAFKSQSLYKILSLLFTANNLSQIARQLNLTRQRVHQVYQMAIENNIPVPKRRR